MYGNKEYFLKFNDGYRSNITLGNNNIFGGVAKGAMDVQTKEGTKSVQDIYYTPKIKHNSLSVGQLCEKNYREIFENMKSIIYDKNRDNKVIIIFPMKNNRMPL